MYYEKKEDGYVLRIRVSPGASKCAVTGIFIDTDNREYLKVGLNAAPEKGKANQELINYLSKILKQSKSAFTILNGKTDRYKKIFLNITPSIQTETLLDNIGLIS